MIGYTCKYAPVELLQALGGQCVFIDIEIPEGEVSTEVSRLHSIKYARDILSYCHSKGIKELIIPGCSDIAQRAYDILKVGKEFKFLFYIDLPYKGDRMAIMKYKAELVRFMQEYTLYKGEDLLFEDFLKRFAFAFTAEQEIQNAKCGSVRHLEMPEGNRSFDELMNWYAGALLSQPPCVRMGGSIDEKEYVNKGEEVESPFIDIEKKTDDGIGISENSGIAAAETASEHVPEEHGDITTPATTEEIPPARDLPDTSGRKTFGGVDIGTAYTHAAVISDKGELLATARVRSSSDPAIDTLKAFGQIHDTTGIDIEDIENVAGCGLPAYSVPAVSKVFDSGECLLKAVTVKVPGVRTILDLGAHGCRYYTIDKRGGIRSVSSSENCASASGRFLDMAAEALQIKTEEIDSIGSEWEQEVELSETCAVFAAAELRKLAEKDLPYADIIYSAEVMYTDKVLSSIKSWFKFKSPVVICGGPASVRNIAELIESGFSSEIIVDDDPFFTAAIGAAMLAAGI